MKLYIGTSGFGYKAWNGKFYPKDLPAAEMLRYYAERFNAVEINNTYYRMPDASVLQGWANDVPADFQFAFKSPGQITHTKRLKNADEAVTHLFDVVGVLEQPLAPLLFGLPPNFKKDTRRLADFLATLPTSCRAAFEFRHQSWFDDDVFQLLRDHGAALCIAEDENELKVPVLATTDWGYLRPRRLDYLDADLQAWASKITAQSWNVAYVFFKHEDEAKGPVFASKFSQLVK